MIDEGILFHDWIEYRRNLLVRLKMRVKKNLTCP